MARKTGGRTRTPSTTPTRRQARDTSLIDWDEHVRNAHVLDWRGRAREFGLLPAGDGDTDDAVVAAATPPERLLEEEEPEAFDEQPIAASGADGEPGDASGGGMGGAGLRGSDGPLVTREPMSEQPPGERTTQRSAGPASGCRCHRPTAPIKP